MSRKTLNLDETLSEYLWSVTDREPALLKQLRDETDPLPLARMQIAPEQGQFMGLLVRLTGVRNAIEVGTFTGYSALCIALALPDNGKLVCCDVSREWTDIARKYWDKAKVTERINLHLRPAADTLKQLLAEGKAGSFDFAFIDADKENYDQYYELCLRLLRPGGLVVIDNALWGGSVIDPEKNDADTVAIRLLNKKLHKDPRVLPSMLPVGDGLTLAMKC